MKRKTSPLVWVLVIVLGLFVLGVLGIGGVSYFLIRHPGAVLSKIITAANPNVEVLRTDEGAGTITLRDKKTGKTVTMNFDDAKRGKFSFSAQGDDGKTATMEFGADAGKLPSWVPAYPGAKVEGTFAIKGDSGDGSGEGGTFAFTTKDAGPKVMSFYEDKCKELGLKVNMTTRTDEGGMVMAADEGEKRSLSIVVGGGSGSTSVSVTYGLKK